MSDTLAALQTALKPKTGMRRIPFPTEIYQHPSLPLTAKKLLNLMVEQAPPDARTATPLVSTPALVPYGTMGSGPILAINTDMPGFIYVVSGTEAFRIFPTPAGPPLVEFMGDVGAPDAGPTEPPWNSFVTIAAGPTAVVINSTPNAFTCPHAPGATLEQITDPDFPGATSVCYVDGYFVFSSLGDTARWFISKVLDPTSFDALDFAFSDGMPNVIRRVISHREQVWTIGEAGFEVWYNAGSSGLETAPGVSFFPFRRMAGGVVPIGTGSPMSVWQADQSVFWVGLDGNAYRSNGYTPKRISTHAIEAILLTSTVGVVALTHPWMGHTFYCVTTLGGRTLVYDIATDKWHERSTSADGDGPWQASVAASDNNAVHLFGDRASGQLYTLGAQADDAGVTVIRQAVLPPLWADTRRAFCARAEVEMEVGGTVTPGPVSLDWSDDGARTWKPARVLATGATGETRKRVFTTRLGSFRQRTFRLTTHGLTRLYAMDVDIAPGDN